MIKLSALGLSMLVIHPVQAAITVPPLSAVPLQPATITDKTLAALGLRDYQDDITPDQQTPTLSPAEKHEAAVWGLSDMEESRYLLLMHNKSAVYYQGLNLTPIDILGLNARSEVERSHLAELAARQEAQKIAQNLAWNNAFHQAYMKLTADVPVVGETNLQPFSPYAIPAIDLEANDRLYLFLRPDEPVHALLNPLIERITSTPNTQLHLLLLTADEVGIQAWANAYALPQALVNSGRLSLNQGDLAYQSLNIHRKSTPLLLRARQNESVIIPLGRS